MAFLAHSSVDLKSVYNFICYVFLFLAQAVSVFFSARVP